LRRNVRDNYNWGLSLHGPASQRRRVRTAGR